MADNVTADPGAGGAVFAADDIASVYYPRIKITIGADGVNDGDVAAGNPLPVTGTVAVTNAGLTELAAAIDTELQVDVVGSLPAGTNNIGDVDVLSVIPGTGATNLGKAIDSAVGATDTGVLVLAKHQADSVAITTADGDYDTFHIDSRGAVVSNIEQHHVFDSFDATTGWSALGNDTLNLATTTKHVTGTAALTFDKVNGAANTVFAGIQKTLSSVNLGDVSLHDLLQGAFYLPTITDVSYVFLRLGTDSTNYNEWRLPDTALTAATWLTGSQAVGDASYAGITGNGWNPAAVTYIAVGVAFDAETNTLAGIVFDEVSYHTNTHTSSTASIEVTSDVTTPNVNVHRVGGSPTDTNTGTVSAGTMRVTLATNVAFPAGDNNIGNVDIVTVPAPLSTTGTGTEATALRVTIATDSTGVLSVDDNGSALTVDNGGTFAVQVDGSALTALQLIDDPVVADDAAFTLGTGKVMMVGGAVVAHGANPDAADAADGAAPLMNRHRIPFNIGGHPNQKTCTYLWTAATTDDNVMPAISAGTKYVVTRLTFTLDESTTVGVAVRVGFGTANVPALPAANADAVDDILFYHPGMVPGSMHTVGDGSSILGVGGDGSELRITSEATTGGTGVVNVTYFTIES